MKKIYLLLFALFISSAIAQDTLFDDIKVNNHATIVGNITNLGSAFISGDATISTSLRAKAGVFFKIVTTGTNYTASISDDVIQYRATTALVVTNFLPAISTTITNGFTLVIKDGQTSSSVTNIVIFPNGTDTIGNSTNKIINANGGSVNISVDGPNKNWFIW